MFAYKPEGAKVHIKAWLNKEAYHADEKLVEQVERVARLPFIFHHVAVAPDGHMGYGLNIGGIAACKNVIVPYFVGSDIGCGMRFVKTNIKVSDINKDIVTKLKEAVKKVVPAGKSTWHKEYQDSKYLPNGLLLSKTKVAHYEHVESKINLYIGTLGAGNHFI